MNLSEKKLIDTIQTQINELQRTLNKLRSEAIKSGNDEDSDSIRHIVRTCCAVCGVAEKEVMNNCRKTDCVDCRKIIAMRLNKLGYGWSKIALELNCSRHSSAVHWVTTGKGLLQYDAIFADKYERCMNALQYNNQ